MSLTVGDILKVVAILQWVDGDILQNVFNVVIGGAGGPYDEADVIDDMVDWMDAIYANIVARVSDELDGSEVRCYEYDPVDDDWDEIGSDSFTFNPSDALHQMPRGVASLINAKTTDPDVNGKKYIGGITEGWFDDGLHGASILATLALVGADWVTPFAGSTSGADFVPGIWSPTRTNFYACSGTIIIPSIPAYQRRRKQGVGI